MVMTSVREGRTPMETASARNAKPNTAAVTSATRSIDRCGLRERNQVMRLLAPNAQNSTASGRSCLLGTRQSGTSKNRSATPSSSAALSADQTIHHRRVPGGRATIVYACGGYEGFTAWLAFEC
jgi:hypothetical protein